MNIEEIRNNSTLEELEYLKVLKNNLTMKISIQNALV